VAQVRTAQRAGRSRGMQIEAGNPDVYSTVRGRGAGLTAVLLRRECLKFE